MDDAHLVSEAAAARMAEVRRALVALKATAGRTIWRLGALLLEVERDRLYAADGAASFSAWLRTSGFAAERSARRAMRIAAALSEKVATRFGVEKLDATISWLDATIVEEQPGDLLIATVRVRGPAGTFRSVPYVDATPADLRAATRLLLGARAGGGAGVRDDLAAAAGVAPRRLRIRDDAAGRRVTLRDASLDELRALVAALEAEGG